MYQGSCLCGQIQVEINGPISAIIHCHCSRCRKTSGTAYATNGFVLLADFAITQSSEQLAFYEATPGKKRYFCRTCACPVYSSNSQLPDNQTKIGHSG
jgi:hypothetical protein